MEKHESTDVGQLEPLKVVDTRKFYPKMGSLLQVINICEGMVDHDAFEQRVAWQTILDDGHWRRLQGFYGRTVWESMIPCGFITTDKDQEPKVAHIQWVGDFDLPFFPFLYDLDPEEDESGYDSTEERFVDYIQSITGQDMDSFIVVPHLSCNGDESDGEYFWHSSYDIPTQYAKVDGGRLLLVLDVENTRYMMGYQEHALRVFVDSETNQEYICIDNTIVYLDNMERVNNG